MAAESAKAGDPAGAALALQEGVALLRQGGPSASGFRATSEAYYLGRQAASVGQPATAREAYRAGLASIGGEDVLDSNRGPLLLATGDAWTQEGKDEKALESYRGAVVAQRLVSTSINRLNCLTALIKAEAKAGEKASLEALIEEGIEVVEGMGGGSPEEGAGIAVHRLARAAEAADRLTQARRAYELALDLLGEGSTQLPRAIVWQDIGDTWIAEDDGTRALRAYRTASENLAFMYPISRLLLFSDLAPAELRWGERSTCEATIRQAAELLEEIPPAAAPDSLSDALTALTELSEQLGCPELAAAFAGRLAESDEPAPAASGQ
ncbi:MAG TPA: hypothetical protein VFJ65_02285 [Solirubrobacterales bacterium]|nr:hypothetical protein [Solirubrobacterales bacterium]